MARIGIWFRAEFGNVEKIDECPKSEINQMFYEYQMAFGLIPGQHRYGKDKLWIGRKKDEPK